MSKGKSLIKKVLKFNTFYVQEIRFSVQNNVVSVCCSYLNMVFPYIGNVNHPHGRTDQQQHFKSKRKISNAAKIALHFTERPLTTVVTLCMLSLEAARSLHSLGMILDQRFKRKFWRPKNTSSTFLKFELSSFTRPMLKTRKNTIRNLFEQQWFHVNSF